MQNKRSKEKASSRKGSNSNGQTKMGSTYFLFHFFMLCFYLWNTCSHEYSSSSVHMNTRHTRLHLFLFSGTVNTDSIQTEHACTNVHSYTHTQNNSKPEAPQNPKLKKLTATTIWNPKHRNPKPKSNFQSNPKPQTKSRNPKRSHPRAEKKRKVRFRPWVRFGERRSLVAAVAFGVRVDGCNLMGGFQFKRR